MDPFYKPYADELKPYVIDLEKEGIEGVKGKLIFMFLKDRKGGYGSESEHFLLRSIDPPFGRLDSEHQQYFLSQDGILIKNIVGYNKTILPPWIDVETHYIFFDVNLEDKSKINLTIDRNDVVTNDKLNNLKTKIEKIIIDHIEKIFLQKHLVTDERGKNYFIGDFFCEISAATIDDVSDLLLERMKKVIPFRCSVNGNIKYLRYNELKDRRKYFYLIENGGKELRSNTSWNMEKAIEKAYPEDLILYISNGYLEVFLQKFRREYQIIVTNKELGFSFDKYLLVSSAEKRHKKEEEYGFTFEGDYKDCFGTLTLATGTIAPNINHPFMRLVNKNIEKIEGKDKKDHDIFIGELLAMYVLGYLNSLKEIQRTQKLLLDFYVEKGILTKEEVEMYVLTEKDFCPYDMGDDFLK